MTKMTDCNSNNDGRSPSNANKRKSADEESAESVRDNDEEVKLWVDSAEGERVGQ